jgi:acyl-CoA thioester hydrolase
MALSRVISSETEVRVRYADTDQMKRAYYGRFFEYFEQGRSDLLRMLGMPYPVIEEKGFYLPVVEAHASYMRSALYDDLLIVKTMLRDLPQARLRIEYEVTNGATRERLAEGYTVHTFISATTGRPVRPPEEFRQIIEHHLLR